MKKKLLAVFVLMLIFSSASFAQWNFVKNFVIGPKPHGVVVDKDNHIWIGFYAYTDTIFTAANDTIPIAPIYVYNFDGTQTSFSPVRFLTVDGVTDTIATYCRGLSLDNNGNVLFSGNQVLYRINYKTGEGMNKYMYPKSGSLTNAASDENGYVYITKVVPGGYPLVILDQDFQPYSYVVDSLKTIQRSLLVSPDGKNVYVGTIYNKVNGIRHYYSADGPDGEYALVDTLGSYMTSDTTWKVMWAQSLDWDPWGNMWVGTYWDVKPGDFTGWYQLDPKKNWAIVDSLGHNFGADSLKAGAFPAGGTYYAPRHIAFYQDGSDWYALTCDFDGGVVKLWKNSNPYTGVIEVKNGLVRNFDLKQNYPNPFNPTTTIAFSIEKRGLVNLKVYNINGQLVSTLVNRPMTPGSYSVKFDGRNLASGMYYYRLTVDGKLMTKKMTLLK
ncbi:two component regulator propeller [bacterium BMS3Bbin03]|nr:two component regulator propeller [bacterium BMS3Bbin03]